MSPQRPSMRGVHETPVRATPVHDDPPRTLVVSPSFLLRSAYSLALEDQGHVVMEAGSADEVLWSLVAARTGDGEPVDLIIADAATFGARALLTEVRASPRPPAMVVVGVEEPSDDELAGTVVVSNARKLDDVLSAVSRALAGSHGREEGRRDVAPQRVLVAVADDARREALVGALARRGAGVIELEDGLALLEFLGRQLNQPGGWYPDAVVLDARLPRMDGVDALDEVRQYDPKLRAIVLAAADDRDAAERVRSLTPAALFDVEAALDDVVDRLLRRHGATTRTLRPLRR